MYRNGLADRLAKLRRSGMFLGHKGRQYAHRQPKYAAPTELGCILGGLVAINMALLKELLNNTRRKSV